MEDRMKYKIDIQINDVANKCLRHIHKITEIVSLINDTIQSYNKPFFPPLEVDALPIRFTDPEVPQTDVLPKDQALDWLFEKSFEEFIAGITKSLIEAYIDVHYVSFARKTKIQPYEQDKIAKEIQDIKERPLKLFMPTLVEKIEEELKVTLQLRDEILSINQVRNFLVHNNGIANKSCNLNFLELVVYTIKDGKHIEIKLEHKSKGMLIENIGHGGRNKTIHFKKGDKVKITPKMFNDISFTCIQFISHLQLVVTNLILEYNKENDGV